MSTKAGLLFLISVALFAPAFALSAYGAQTAFIPDFSGQWGRDMGFFEPPSSGPGPVVNAIRNKDGSRNLEAPCCDIPLGGWVGDDTNPILKPEAAAAMRKFRELSESGTVIQDLHNSC